MCSGSRSSVQNAIRLGPNSCTSGRSARRLRAIDASRISSHIPARNRSRPSSTVSASWSERMPDATYAFSSLPSSQGATDVMVELNFDRTRPPALLNLNEVAELRGWSRENGALRLASGLTYSEAERGPLAEAFPALAQAART